MHSDAKLYLIFEFLDLDLKKYMDSIPNGLAPELIKVGLGDGCLRTGLDLAKFTHFAPIELPLPNHQGNQLLPLPSHPPPGLEATEL